MSEEQNSSPENEVPKRETVVLTDAEQAERKKRNWMIAGALVFFVSLIFATTIIRIGQNVAAG